MGTYVYDQQWQEERQRLVGMEALWDPGTKALMERLGVSDGWQCLEVGAGGGSMTEWMSEQVGPSGKVLAVDVYTKFLDAIDRPNVEVREHDILGGEPLPTEHDLVYARLVVEHLGTRALDPMLAALKPGGVLLLEDYDFAASAVQPSSPLYDRVTQAILGFMSDAGFDPHMGRRLSQELRGVGLEDVRAEGRARLYRGGDPESAFGKLSLSSLGPALVESGRLSHDELDEALGMVDEPENNYVSPLMVAAWGTKPA